MKKFSSLTLLILVSMIWGTSCKKDDITTPKNEDPSIVTQFVYDGMSTFYLWADNMVNKKPKQSDTDPKKYFQSVLHKTDIEHEWSWITDDIDELLKDFEGEATDAFGFSPLALWTDKSQTQLVGFIRYVYPNTPASQAGVERGNVITKIDGKNITISNYSTLFGASQATTFTVLDQNYENPREVKITPRSFATDPVLYHNVYEIDTKKIAYLFYTGYRSNYNDRLYEVFSNFKQAGATELVLDLRYNPGGDISAVIYLASLIAPAVEVEKKSIFNIMSYNSFVNSIFEGNGWERGDRLGEYDARKFPNPLKANLNLKKVYILTSHSSASASELTTFCLKPYMEVEHIGETTAGKYTASWTIHAYNSFIKNGQARAQPIYEESKLSSDDKNQLKNWAMQPIVGRYTDKNGKDFIADGALIPNHPIESEEYHTETWKPIGDESDYLFAKAISLITGRPYRTSSVRSASHKNLIDAELYSPSEKLNRRGVIIDNINTKQRTQVLQ